MPDGAPFFVVLNPKSGKRGDEDARAVIKETLTRAGRACSVYEHDGSAAFGSLAVTVTSMARSLLDSDGAWPAG